jgi:glutamyl-tRNA reductase
MGHAAVSNLAGRGARLHIASRTSNNAVALATRFGGHAIAIDPGATIAAQMTGVVVALRGQWRPAPETIAALAGSLEWAIDVSSPPALETGFVAALGERLLTIDDLALPEPNGEDSDASRRLVARLDALIAETAADFERWTDAHDRREAAEALIVRARSLRALELERLWRRLPALDDGQRAEVARALDHVTTELLREPLEQLGRDPDERHLRAARELFRL